MMRPDLPPAVWDFLDRTGWGMALITPLAADFSTRRFFRVCDDTEEAILMLDAPGAPALKSFLRVDALLRQLELAAPMILGSDIAAGAALVEDLGACTAAQLLDSGMTEEARDQLYLRATELLVQLHRRFDPRIAEDVPRYDAAALAEIAALLVRETLPACGRPLATGALTQYLGVWQNLLRPLDSERPTLMLRDFHMGNLIPLAGGQGARGLGLIDFQDAGLGPRLYDLASLLYDTRRDIPPALRRRCLACYHSAFPERDAAHDRAAFTILAAQRLTRILAIFDRLARQPGRETVRPYRQRAAQTLQELLAQEDILAPLAAWHHAHAPLTEILACGPA